MAYVTLDTKPVGSVVKLNISGVARDFIVVHQGLPSAMYDASCNGTWLVMKDIYENAQWDTSTNSYSDSSIHNYLNNSFKNYFDINIQNAIKWVKIPYRPGSGTGSNINSGGLGLTCRIFLLSAVEVGFKKEHTPNLVEDGTKLSYFDFQYEVPDNSTRIAYFNGTASFWLLRSPFISIQDGVWLINNVGNGAYNSPYFNYGVRPALIVPPSLLVSDDGTIITNTAPTAPSSITVPATVVGGSTLSISWGASSDAEGNLSGYKLERSVAGGAWAQIYQGGNRSHTDTITKGWATVQYRVKAYDSFGFESAYTTSPSRTVDNNTAPTIACSTSGDIGAKGSGFEISYQIHDAESDAVTVVERMDNAVKRTYTATLGGNNVFAVTGEYFMKLLNGNHVMTITATDPGGKSATHTITFEKTVHALRITMAAPMTTDALITKMAMNIARNIPADANFKVVATNNANDASPVWEDITTIVETGRNHIFINTAVQNGHAFNFVITASRGSSNQGGHIGSIGGAFE